MAALTALSAVGGGLQAGGTILGAMGQNAAGQNADQQYRYKAAQEFQAAGQSRAAAQREMFDTDRKTALLQSTFQARSASDGGTSTDPGALTLSEGIAGQGEYNALADLYRGEDKAKGLEMQAQNDLLSGKAARRGGQASAIGTLLSGSGSLFSKFGSKDRDARF